MFNYQGGCCAKALNLGKEHEPEIYAAIRREALLENLVVDSLGNIDDAEATKTGNSGASYPTNQSAGGSSPVSSDSPIPAPVQFC